MQLSIDFGMHTLLLNEELTIILNLSSSFKKSIITSEACWAFRT